MYNDVRPAAVAKKISLRPRRVAIDIRPDNTKKTTSTRLSLCAVFFFKMYLLLLYQFLPRIPMIQAARCGPREGNLSPPPGHIKTIPLKLKIQFILILNISINRITQMLCCYKVVAARSLLWIRVWMLSSRRDISMFFCTGKTIFIDILRDIVLRIHTIIIQCSTFGVVHSARRVEEFVENKETSPHAQHNAEMSILLVTSSINV